MKGHLQYQPKSTKAKEISTVIVTVLCAFFIAAIWMACLLFENSELLWSK